MKSRLVTASAALGLAVAFATAASAAAVSGKAIYDDNCLACHQATGAGMPPTFPALKGSKVVTGPKPVVLATVLNGRGAMPSWKSQFNDAQVAAVTTYIRSSWGNKAPAVTVAEAAAARKGKLR